MIELSAVMDGSPENKAFAKATPFADFKLSIDNPNAWGNFLPGEDYYLDISPAPKFVEPAKGKKSK